MRFATLTDTTGPVNVTVVVKGRHTYVWSWPDSRYEKLAWSLGRFANSKRFNITWRDVDNTLDDVVMEMIKKRKRVNAEKARRT